MLPLSVVHYSSEDPRSSVGGVQRFARNLERIFAEVRFLTPRGGGGGGEREAVIRARLPVICDNHCALDWPPEHPVIGFQHGVAAVKYQATHSPGHWLLARAQRRAAGRPNTLWVACAEWVSQSFGRLYGNAASFVIYYPVDTERFDGRLANAGSRLLLHDARTVNKGRRLLPRLQRAFPDWRFEPLACAPEAVPDRMRGARGFVHLSRYEGNSLVCGEAMGMDLPCLFTRVGLLQDVGGPTDLWPVEPGLLRGSGAPLLREVAGFLDSLDLREYHPRAWVMTHATLALAEARWQAVLLEFERRFGWELGLARA